MLVTSASRLLAAEGASIRLDVDRWENTAAHRSEQDTVNLEFVERARRAHLTVALLMTELRPGTLEELTAVLETTDRDVAVLWFMAEGETPRSELEEFVRQNHDRVLYSMCGPPDGDRSWDEAMKVVVRLIIRAFRQLAGTEMFFDAT